MTSIKANSVLISSAPNKNMNYIIKSDPFFSFFSLILIDKSDPAYNCLNKIYDSSQ